MKKLLVFLFALFFFSISSFAQIQLGLKGGLNLSSLKGDDAPENAENRTGFAGGAFLQYQFSSMFAIQPELTYSMKGATEKGNFDFEGFQYDYDATYKLNYLEIPVLLKLIIPTQGAGVRPTIFAGPSVAFKMSSKQSVEINGQSVEDDLENIKSTDFGLVFGGGLGFPLGKGELGFDIRYILGLSTIDDSSDNYDVKNGVINFNLYYGFNLP